MESTFARTDSLSPVLLKKKITRRSGTSLDPDDNLKPMKPRSCRTVPLAIISAGKEGKPTIDNSLILDTREGVIPLDTTKPYKINANTTGVCMSSSIPDHLPILCLTSPGRSCALQS